jgi:hypothetical protein
MSDIRMVVVPGGLTSDAAALVRVLVVPRLDGGTLADFGLADWPSVLADASFELHVSMGGQERVAGSARLRELRARSEIWQAFFSGDASIISNSRGGRAGSVNVAPKHGPAVAATALYRNAAIDMAAPGPAAQTISQRLRSWQRMGRTPPGGQAPPRQAPLPPQVDFEWVLAMVRQHPSVLPELGLVFELEVDPGELGGSSAGPAQGMLSLRCPDPPLSSLVIPPFTWTRYELSDLGFWPAGGATSTPQIDHGAIDLRGAQVIDGTVTPGPPPPPPWAITVMDVDGAIGGLDAAAGRLGQAGSAGQDAVLPGLRSAGLVLLRPGRDFDVASRLSAAARFDQAGPAITRPADAAVAAADLVLSAEDLLLGYRVDIRTGDDPAWRSLCKRETTYSVNGMPIGTSAASPGQPGSGGPVPVVEEGHLASLTATRDDNGDLHADELFLHCSGWSLSVPDIDLLGQRDPGPPARLPYAFTWTPYQVPDHSLPQLRFSSRYQMRIRVADVTGGGLDESVGDDLAPPSTTIIYTRHDPIQPPTLVLGGPPTLGAGPERLVVRSGDAGATASDARSLAPPTVARQLAEQHAMFDDVSDGQSWAWVQRAMRVAATGTVGEQAPAGLADPAANGINAFLPAQAGVTAAVSERINWYPGSAFSWPDPEPKSIRLSAVSAAPPGAPTVTIGWSGDVLDVQLAAGREVVLELSSTLRPGFLDHFTIGNWLSEAHAPLPQTEVGRNPVLSPVRPVHLVHAVRKPLTPQVTSGVPEQVPHWSMPPSAIGRTAGATHADLSPTFEDAGLDPGSTGRLEVHASWPEPVGADASGVFVHGETMPAQGPVALNFLHDFGDTKHRIVTYTLTAISRFRQYFDHGDEPDANFQLVQAQAPVHVLSTVQPPEVKVAAVLPSFAWTATASASRIEHTRSSWRLRLEVSGSWYRTGIGERLAVVLAPKGTGGGSPSFSALGRDPASATAPTGPTLPLSWCAGAAGTVPGFPLPGGGPPADLALYDVFADGDGYYCDIELRPPDGATASYGPLVRLSVARYQPHSLTGLELSPPTMTDWAQLLPDRHVTVDLAAQGLSVLIDGLGPAAPNPAEVVLEELTGELPGSQFPEVLLAVDSDDTAGVPVWRAAAGSTVARGAVGSPIAIPLTPSAAHPQRLRVTEIQKHGPSAGANPADTAELTQRSAFIDVVNLPESWTSSSP